MWSTHICLPDAAEGSLPGSLEFREYEAGPLTPAEPAQSARIVLIADMASIPDFGTGPNPEVGRPTVILTEPSVRRHTKVDVVRNSGGMMRACGSLNLKSSIKRVGKRARSERSRQQGHLQSTPVRRPGRITQEGQADNDRWGRTSQSAILDDLQKLQLAETSGLDFTDNQIARVITRKPERCDAVLGLEAPKAASTQSCGSRARRPAGRSAAPRLTSKVFRYRQALHRLQELDGLFLFADV